MSSVAPGILFLGKARVPYFTEESDLQGFHEVYFKNGRTTGLTGGRISVIDPVVKLELPPNSDHPEGATTIITQECSIIHQSREPGEALPKKGIRAPGSSAQGAN